MPNLTTVTLPANLTGIPKDAFANSTKLATVKFGDADASNGGGSPSGRAVTGADNAITLPTGITTIDANAFAGTAATTVDLSLAGGTQASTGRVAAAAATPNPLSVGSNAFTNMANLTTVTLPATATNIDPANFGNPATATEQKLQTIQYGTDSTTTTTPATATLSNPTISSPNFSKIKNSTIEINSYTQQPINFNGGVFNGNKDLTTLKLNVTQQPNGNSSL